MLPGVAPGTIYNCVFMVAKTKLKMQRLESTHHAFLRHLKGLAHEDGESREGQGRTRCPAERTTFC